MENRGAKRKTKEVGWEMGEKNSHGRKLVQISLNLLVIEVKENELEVFVIFFLVSVHANYNLGNNWCV
jgi:hypothetical protein